MGFNVMMLMKLKQEIDKFKKGEESLIKIYRNPRYPGFDTFELSLRHDFFEQIGFKEFFPKDVPQLEESKNGENPT